MTIPVFQPTHSWRDAWAVAKVLRSRWTGKGPLATQFRDAWAAHLQVSPAKIVLLHCCTEALFQSVALYTSPKDSVLLPAIHFIGAGNAVLGQNRKLELCDVNPRTLMASAADVEKAITSKTRMVLLLHYGGMANRDTVPIRDLCHSKGIVLVEDAACGPSTRMYDERMEGKSIGTIGDYGCWSFDSMKVLSAGDAGAAYVENNYFAHRLSLLTGCGLQSAGASSSGPRWWEYEVDTYGRSSHINDITAAVLLCQLKRLPRLILKRKGVLALYDSLLCNLPWITSRPSAPEGSTDSGYFMWIQTKHRDRLAKFLKDRGVYCTFRYHLLSKAYDMGGNYPGAERAARDTLLLPCHANLTKKDVERIAMLVYDFGKTL